MPGGYGLGFLLMVDAVILDVGTSVHHLEMKGAGMADLESTAPLTAALVKRHQEETEALDSRFPDRGTIATRHEWREHSLRQARELLEHAADMERKFYGEAVPAPLPEGREHEFEIVGMWDGSTARWTAYEPVTGDYLFRPRRPQSQRFTTWGENDTDPEHPPSAAAQRQEEKK
jgi:hypothetical protein